MLPWLQRRGSACRRGETVPQNERVADIVDDAGGADGHGDGDDRAGEPRERNSRVRGAAAVQVRVRPDRVNHLAIHSTPRARA